MNDDQFTPVKLLNTVITELDKIKNMNPFFKSRPQVITYLLHRYIENGYNTNWGDGNREQNIYNCKPTISDQQKKEVEKKDV